MKPYFLVLLVGIGSAWGQTTTPVLSGENSCPFVAFTNDADKSEQCAGTLPPSSDYPLRVWRGGSGSLCDATVEFHGHAKLIKDIFPEECGTVVGHFECTSDPGGMSGSCGCVPKGSLCGMTIGDPPGVDEVPDGFGHACGAYPCPESPDVPALQERVRSCPPSSSAACCGDDCAGNKWGCADKSRILLTAEDGKKWCHKPQP
jgi:hypothetical protein